MTLTSDEERVNSFLRFNLAGEFLILILSSCTPKIRDELPALVHRVGKKTVGRFAVHREAELQLEV